MNAFTCQMIKGVRVGGMGKALSYLDQLTVPIIENTPHEEDLKDSMALVRISPPTLINSYHLHRV